MRTPYLVQRLEAPRGVSNSFSFGGGLTNGGLTPETMQILNSIFSFDYMGSAEFEWGAVPKALQELAKADLVTEKYKTIFILTPKEILEDVKSWLDLAIKKEQPQLKERLGLVEALRKDEYAQTLGWLKIEGAENCKEPFMFFIDEEMFEKTKKLLEVK